jgi:voltage-gated potassium channel
VRDVAGSAPSPSGEQGAELVALLLSLAGGVQDSGGTTLGYEGWKRELKSAVAKDPFDATVVTVFGGAFLFYMAEKGKNPKVTSYWDALVFISTCLSVGYHDVFARTPGGKAIATAVMTIGPALSGAIFEGGETERAEKTRAEEEAVKVQQAIASTLGEILKELRAQTSSSRAPSP